MTFLESSPFTWYVAMSCVHNCAVHLKISYFHKKLIQGLFLPFDAVVQNVSQVRGQMSESAFCNVFKIILPKSLTLKLTMTRANKTIMITATRTPMLSRVAWNKFNTYGLVDCNLNIIWFRHCPCISLCFYSSMTEFYCCTLYFICGLTITCLFICNHGRLVFRERFLCQLPQQNSY